MLVAQSGAMSDHLVRVDNLKAIQRAHGWNDTDLAKALGRTPQQVYSWWHNKRMIGERLARDLEVRLQLERYALDDRGTPPDSSAVKAVREPTPPPLVTVTKRAKEVPVLAWDGIRTMLDADNTALKQKATHLETYAVCSGKAKFLQMPDDSMAPEIAPGDHLLFDPTEAPRAGDIVLVLIASGDYLVRRFRPKTAYVFEATAANEDYQAVSSTSDEAKVCAVLVEHRRYRRPG